MKKALAAIIMLVGICGLPIMVRANAPIPPPNRIAIAIEDYSSMERVSLYGAADGEDYFFISDDADASKEETRRADEIILHMEVNHANRLKLQITLKDGRTVESNPAKFEEYGTYLYSVERNVLEQGQIASRRKHGMDLVFGVFMLAVPLVMTLVVERLIALAFALEPLKYVMIINLITNPLMNILLNVFYNKLYMQYYQLLIIFELMIMALEFCFYTFTYRETSKKRLLLFSLAANGASWGIYFLISNWWYL